MLSFGKANAKLRPLELLMGPIATFSLPSGHTCPCAKDCLSKAIRTNGKTTIQDGKYTKFRCYSASEEVLYPNVYDSRWGNFNTLRRNHYCMADVIGESIPQYAKTIRVHVAGDFFNYDYFVAWMNVARNYTDKNFYAYTKCLRWWAIGKAADIIPSNFILTASYGGTQDSFANAFGLRHCVVIADHATCDHIIKSGQTDYVTCGPYRGYPIDHDDRHAALVALKDTNFALLVHGVQPAESEAQKARKVLNGVGQYRRTH